MKKFLKEDILNDIKPDGNGKIVPHAILKINGRNVPLFYLVAMTQGIITREFYDNAVRTGNFSDYVCIHFSGNTVDFIDILIVSRKTFNNHLFLAQLANKKNSVVEFCDNGEIKSSNLIFLY